MRMMHESRLWVVHLMIKVLRIRLLEVLVVHLRHRVEETVVIVVVVVVLLLLLINRPARRRRLRRRRRRMEAQLLHIFVFFLCGVSPEKTKLRRLKCRGRETKRHIILLLFLVVLPFCLFFRESRVKKRPQKMKKRRRYLFRKEGKNVEAEHLPHTWLTPPLL